MAWRRNKIAELKGKPCSNREYPANAAEARSKCRGMTALSKPADVVRAPQGDVRAIGPLVIGADPARFGNDRFSLAWRQGRQVHQGRGKAKLDTVAGANWIKQVIDTDKPARVFIDVGGIGAGVYDLLKSWGGIYESTCVPIDFAGSPQQAEIVLPSGESARGRTTAALRCGCAAATGSTSRAARISRMPTACRPTPAGRATTTTPTATCCWRAKEHMRDVRKLRSP